MNSFQFYINRTFTKNNGTCAVYLISSVNGQKVKFNTGISVVPTEWCAEKNEIKGGGKAIKDQNLILKNCAARLTNIFVKYRLREKELTAELVRKEYNNPTAGIDFYSFWEREMKSKKDFNSPNTIKQHESVLAKLKRFKKTCSFSELDHNFLIEYQRYCKTHKETQNKQNTINKNLKTIKVYVSLALQQELIEKSPFEFIKIKAQHANILFLEPSEVKNLVEKYNKKLFSKQLHETLRRYLFSCFTGIRLSDSLAVTYNNIVNNTLVLQPKKTKELTKIVRIPLNAAALELIKERSEGLLFPIKRVEQTINVDLKTIADGCGIKKLLSFHSSRHTFATLYYRTTKDIVGLQKLLGHSDIKNTMVYTHVVTSDIELDIKRLEKYWH
jgi:integrase/recombinase XerD